MEKETDHVREVPAPLIFLGVLILGLWLGRVFPVRFLPGNLSYVVGVVLVVVALWIGGSALMAMRRARTSPIPSRPATTLVESGFFRHSRNPMYLSMFVLYLGITASVNVVWLLLFFPILLLLVDRLVVSPEESYLSRKFGDDYKRYRTRVRRWI